jgi:protein involved in polysaccharide export with SLBB domain
LFLALAGSAAGLGGCESDSYFNPAQVGRFEQVPTTVPLLERLNVVEGGDAANPNIYTTPTAEDLTVEPESYRVGPGDGLDVTVEDFVELGKQEKYERLLDDRGFIELPRLGPVFVAGQTGTEAADTIARAIKNRRLLVDPIVDANAVQRRKQTFSVMGGVLNPGTYNIPKPDFRLLEALSNAGRFSENVQWVYVIRTVSLAPALTGSKETPVPQATPNTNPTGTPPTTPPKKESVIDLIDSLGKPDDKPTPAPAPTPTPAPEPAPKNNTPAPEKPQATNFGAMQPASDKPVPVIDIDAATKPAAPAPAPAASSPQPLPASEWQFVNGQWVKGTASGRTTSGDPSVGVLSQRVIQIPMQALMNGAAQYNVVIRPGDTIRVQSLAEGIVYVHGNVNRPGVYNLPQTGRMTIQRAIASASDLSEIGIPERVDITRFIGPDRQATVRVNYRSIVEGTQPDIVLRDGDMVNVGTNFWAFPLSVIRNGFRANYGFSFTLDRNFGYDVFGPQKTNANVF